jgi:hypothetical protein
MRGWVWTFATLGTAYVAWLVFRNTGDSALQAGKRVARAATSPTPAAELAGQLQEAWAEHHTTA